MSEFDTNLVSNPLMPWGKYGPNGEEGHTAIKDLPGDYLLWLLEKADSDSLHPKWLNQTVKDEWIRRDKSDFRREAERLRKESK